MKDKLDWCKNLEEKRIIERYLDEYKRVTNTTKKFIGGVCIICGDTKSSSFEGSNYCSKHYTQMRRHGRILSHTSYTPNEIRLSRSYASIITRDKSGTVTGEFLIDKSSIIKVISCSWGNHLGYGRSSNCVLLHRFLMKVKDSKLIVDHINRDTYDNRIENLRVVSSRENSMNCGLSKANKVGFTGIRLRKDGYYIAEIGIKSKNKYLGVSKSLEKALILRLKAEKELLPIGFAPQRHLFEQYHI